jgi:hypothetical protein
MCESLRLVNLLIGQERFEDLLIRMPDGFYNLFPESREWIWGEMLNAVDQGIEDPQALAVIAGKLIRGEPVSVVGAGQLNLKTNDEFYLLPSQASDSSYPPKIGLACSVDDGSSVDEYTQEMVDKLIKEHGDEPVTEAHL